MHAGAPHRVDGGIVLFQQRIADGFVDHGVETGRQIFHRVGELLGHHVLGRRVDEIAQQENGVGLILEALRVDALIHNQPGRLLLGLLIAAKAVTAQRPAQRGALHHVGIPLSIDEIAARGERRCETRKAERIRRIADAGEHPRCLSVFARNQAVGIGLCLEAR